MKIENFTNYKLNESLFGNLIKGSLGKLMNLFSGPFKNLASDIKKFFKPDDPKSIKNVIVTHFNQAIDAAQKSIPEIKDDNAVNDILNKIVDGLIQVANNIEKDISSAVGNKNSQSVDDVIKAILLGDKEAKWIGIVGLLDPTKGISGIKTNYKYSVTSYGKVLADVASKNTLNVLKSKKDASIKFLDAMQKDVVLNLERELSEQEIEKIYNEAKGKTDGGVYKIGDKIVYVLRNKLQDWENSNDETKKKLISNPDSKITNYGTIQDNKNGKFTVLSNNGIRTEKQPNEIVSKVEISNNAQKLKDALGKIKSDDDKMDRIYKYTEFINNPNNVNKIKEINKIIGN